MSTEVFVFADWEEFQRPTLVGTLRSSPRVKKSISASVMTLTGCSLLMHSKSTLSSISIPANSTVKTIRISACFWIPVPTAGVAC